MDEEERRGIPKTQGRVYYTESFDGVMRNKPPSFEQVARAFQSKHGVSLERSNAEEKHKKGKSQGLWGLRLKEG